MVKEPHEPRCPKGSLGERNDRNDFNAFLELVSALFASIQELNEQAVQQYTPVVEAIKRRNLVRILEGDPKVVGKAPITGEIGGTALIARQAAADHQKERDDDGQRRRHLLDR